MRKKALGIDLGTTNSALAIVKENEPEIIPMGASDETVLRSAVYFSNIGGKRGKNRVFFGKDAINRGTEVGKVEYFKQDFKRDIGKNVESETPDHTRVDSTVLSALLLHEFKKRADVISMELQLPSPIKDAVITVPAYFTSEQRAATKNAGILAGFNVLRIINEPTAAAISYAHKKNIQGNILVYDLGGGTFDVTIMRVQGHRYDILATDGNHRLGGLDFDKRLVRLIKEKLENQGVDMTSLSPKEEMRLLYQAEKIKISLSVDSSVFYEWFTEDGEYGVEITQEEFYQTAADLLKDTEIKMQNTLAAAHLSWDDIDHILLVGGSTRMPIVRDMIRELSGQEPRFDLNPDTIVAEGASIIADLLVNDEISFSETTAGKEILDSQIVVRDVTSQGIGILFKKQAHQHYPFVGDFYNRVIVPRNTAIPTVIEKSDLVAVADGQSNFRLRVTEGNSDNPRDVKIILDRVVQLGVSHQKGEKLAIVRYEFDPEQIVHVTILEAQTRKTLEHFTLNTKVNQETERLEYDLTDLQDILKRFI